MSAQDTSVAQARPAPPPRRPGLLRRCLACFGLMSLSFVLGAAVMFFDLPPSSFLRNAFVGGAAWKETWQAAPRPEDRGPLTVGKVDDPARTCDGFTLCMYGAGTRAVLVNMRGEPVHQWQVRFGDLWTNPPHLRGPIDDAVVYMNDGHVYPNGDLLALVEGPIDASNPTNGYGLAKLDKDSRVLWKYPHNCHHDLDVGEDGTIYVLTQEMVDRAPPELDLPTPCMVDFVDVVSPEGKRLKSISLLEALQGTPYEPLFCMLQRPRWFGDRSPGDLAVPPFREDTRRRDVLHANAVKVLPRALAPRFPLFKAGQLLVSLRHLDALVVLDPGSGKAVWAARGPWHAQHDPQFLGNGHLLLFDNAGSPQGSRVLEYDPKTQAFPWSYPGAGGTPFYSRIRGMAQRLANGNTLIANSEGGEVFEVTPGREVVWSCSCGPVTLYRARRCSPGQLPFLGAKRARP